MKNTRHRNFGLQGPALLLSIQQFIQCPILMHKFEHMYDYTYESGDHYDDPDKETGLCSSYCTYGSLTNDLTEMMMCTACKTRIMGNAGRFKHPLKEVTQ